MAYQSNKEESKNIRNLFKTDKTLSGYKLVQNGHSTGTAYGWIKVTVTYPDGKYPDDMAFHSDRSDERSRIYFLIKNIVGRGDCHDDIQTDYFCENISLGFMSESQWSINNQWKNERKERRLKNSTCPRCSYVEKQFQRDGYRYRRVCSACGFSWVHGCA